MLVGILNQALPVSWKSLKILLECGKAIWFIIIAFEAIDTDCYYVKVEEENHEKVLVKA